MEIGSPACFSSRLCLHGTAVLATLASASALTVLVLLMSALGRLFLCSRALHLLSRSLLVAVSVRSQDNRPLRMERRRNRMETRCRIHDTRFRALVSRRASERAKASAVATIERFSLLFRFFGFAILRLAFGSARFSGRFTTPCTLFRTCTRPSTNLTMRSRIREFRYRAI